MLVEGKKAISCRAISAPITGDAVVDDQIPIDDSGTPAAVRKSKHAIAFHHAMLPDHLAVAVETGHFSCCGHQVDVSRLSINGG